MRPGTARCGSGRSRAKRRRSPPSASTAIQLFSVAFSPDGARVAAGGLSGSAWVWDVRSHRLVATLPGRQLIWGVGFSRDSRFLVTAGDDGVARVFATESGRLVAELPSGLDHLEAAAFDPVRWSVAVAGAGEAQKQRCSIAPSVDLFQDLLCLAARSSHSTRALRCFPGTLVTRLTVVKGSAMLDGSQSVVRRPSASRSKRERRPPPDAWPHRQRRCRCSGCLRHSRLERRRCRAQRLAEARDRGCRSADGDAHDLAGERGQRERQRHSHSDTARSARSDVSARLHVSVRRRGLRDTRGEPRSRVVFLPLERLRRPGNDSTATSVCRIEHGDPLRAQSGRRRQRRSTRSSCRTRRSRSV